MIIPFRHKLFCGLSCLGILISILACNIPTSVGSKTSTVSLVDTPPSEANLLEGLSDDQALIVNEFGWPHSFTMILTEDAQGQENRSESWVYYDGKISYIFLNGDFQFDEPVDSPSPDILMTPYHPNQFELGLSPDQLVVQIPGRKWFPLPGVSADQTGMQVLVNEQLLLGFVQGRLVYVEALAFIPEEIEP